MIIHKRWKHLQHLCGRIGGMSGLTWASVDCPICLELRPFCVKDVVKEPEEISKENLSYLLEIVDMGKLRSWWKDK